MTSIKTTGAAPRYPAPELKDLPEDIKAKVMHLHATLAKIKAFRKNLAKGFFDIGLALREIPGRDRTTPAGRFVGGFGPSIDAGRVLWVDYDSGVALHPITTGVPAEKRAERLASASAEDNRVTHGCINISPTFYEQIVRTTFERGGVFYVLPDKASMAETFPEFAQSRAGARDSGEKEARSARK